MRRCAACLLVFTTACEPAPQLAPEDLILWETSAEPILTIGLEDGDPAYLFTQVVGAARLSDGRIVIAESDTREIRYFSPTGTHLRTVGGKGGGPGEFTHALNEFRVGVGDTILALESFDVPWVNRFTAEGEFIDHWKLETRRAWRPGLNMENDREFLADGRLAFELDSMLEQSERSPGRETWKLTVIIDRDNRIDTLGWFRGAPRGWRPFTTRRGLRERRGRLIMMDPDQPALWIHDLRSSSNARIDTVTWSRGPRLPVTDSMRKDFSTRTLGANPGLSDGQGLQLVESILAGAADSLSVIRELHIGPDDNFWVNETPARGDTVKGWMVRNATGSAVGRAVLPALQIFQIGDDFVLGVRYDENRVPYVELYSLRKAAAPSR